MAVALPFSQPNHLMQKHHQQHNTTQQLLMIILEIIKRFIFGIIDGFICSIRSCYEWFNCRINWSNICCSIWYNYWWIDCIIWVIYLIITLGIYCNCGTLFPVSNCGILVDLFYYISGSFLIYPCTLIDVQNIIWDSSLMEKRL